ncbi:unnamed protein product [Orchesella dallaii]|uniref:Uncharacterized protein n=1 Tax=Orchesella dallaii TaxID=48710 RepID=A0ABP1SAN8_9HEXA
MANKLTISALKLQEKLSYYHTCPYILYWDTKTTTSGGKYSTYPPISISLMPWYISTLIVFIGSFVCGGNFVYLLVSPWEGGHQLINIGFSFSVGLLGYLAFGLNVVFFYYADNFAESLNGLIEFGEEIAIAANKPRKIKKSNKNDIIIGMFALQTVVFLNIMPFIIVPFEYLEGLDPTVWVLKVVLGKDFEEVLWPVFRITLLVGRLGVSLAYITEVCRTICVMCLIMILESPLFFLSLGEFRKEALDYPVLRKYWRLCRIRNVNVKSCGQMTAVSMGFCFVMMTFTHVGCIFYWERMSGPILGSFVGTTLVMDSMLHTVLPWVTKLYDMSSRLIKQWRKENAGMERRGIKRRHLGMLLNATRPIAFSIGSVRGT